MSSDAIAIVRDGTAWRARALDLEAAEDLDSLVEQLRDDHSPAAVAFVDQDDEWLAVIRLSGDDDARVFLSDSRFIQSSELAERLFGMRCRRLRPVRTTIWTPPACGRSRNR